MTAVTLILILHSHFQAPSPRMAPRLLHTDRCSLLQKPMPMDFLHWRIEIYESQLLVGWLLCRRHQVHNGE